MNSATFNLEKRKDKKKVVIITNMPIRLSFCFDGKRLEYFTKERVSHIDNFDPYYYKDKRIKGPVLQTERNSARINKKLMAMKLKVEALYDNAVLLGNSPSVEYLRSKLDEQFKGKLVVAKGKLVKDAFQEYITYVGLTRAKNTKKKFVTTDIHLKDFIGEQKYQKIGFEAITDEVAEGFKQYLVGLGFLNNTVVKYSKAFNEFINWCKQKEQKYYEGDVRIKGRENDIEVIYLNEQELEQLKAAPMKSDMLQEIKDIFLFAIYVGARFNDIYNLRKIDDKGQYINFYIEKNHETVSHKVPLVEEARAILDKYKSLAGEMALPVRANATMNEKLKHVMKEAGFKEKVTLAHMYGNGKIEKKVYEKWELISFHSSRKTLISAAVAKKIPENIAKSLTGHSKNSKAFSKYYEVDELTKERAINDIFKKGKPPIGKRK